MKRNSRVLREPAEGWAVIGLFAAEETRARLSSEPRAAAEIPRNEFRFAKIALTVEISRRVCTSHTYILWKVRCIEGFESN